jgi:hypothetical protein
MSALKMPLKLQSHVWGARRVGATEREVAAMRKIH